MSRTSTAHALPAEGKVPKSVRVALTYEKYLFLKYLVKFLRVYLIKSFNNKKAKMKGGQSGTYLK